MLLDLLESPPSYLAVFFNEHEASKIPTTRANAPLQPGQRCSFRRSQSHGGGLVKSSVEVGARIEPRVPSGQRCRFPCRPSVLLRAVHQRPSNMCLFVDGWFAVSVTLLRCMTDAVNLWSMWMKLKTARRAVARGERDGQGGCSCCGHGFLDVEEGLFLLSVCDYSLCLR